MPGEIMADKPASETVSPDYFTTEDFDSALELIDARPSEAAKLLQAVVVSPDADAEDASKKSKMKEEAIYLLGKIYAASGEKEKVSQLMVDIRPFFASISKPRSAKIVRSLIDDISKTPGTEAFLTELCRDSIAWCVAEKRSFLRQRLEARLAALYCATHQYKEALTVTKKLVREVKKFDDKPLMVEVSLVESDVFFALHNIPKSKGALTTARSNANAYYCPPLVQAQIDMQAGIISAAEKDYKTAFSYFYEAYEGFSTGGRDELAVKSLKYMLLSKIMVGQVADVHNVVTSKAGIRYAGAEIDSMRAVASAYKERSIEALEKVLKAHQEQLSGDAIVDGHLSELKGSMLRQNLLRLLEPFSRVEIDHVAALIKLPRETVEAKLGQMILDGELRGILDQGSGDVVLFPPAGQEKAYGTALKVVEGLDGVVDRLYTQTRRLESS